MFRLLIKYKETLFVALYAINSFLKQKTNHILIEEIQISLTFLI
jgi:hypothetical protein